MCRVLSGRANCSFVMLKRTRKQPKHKITFFRGIRTCVSNLWHELHYWMDWAEFTHTHPPATGIKFFKENPNQRWAVVHWTEALPWERALREEFRVCPLRWASPLKFVVRDSSSPFNSKPVAWSHRFRDILTSVEHENHLKAMSLRGIIKLGSNQLNLGGRYHLCFIP